jgi:hypothetical protein
LAREEQEGQVMNKDALTALMAVIIYAAHTSKKDWESDEDKKRKESAREAKALLEEVTGDKP